MNNTQNFDDLIDFTKAKYDANGILVSECLCANEIKISKNAWERIYDFDLEKLKNDRQDFDQCKLADHMSNIERSYKFDQTTVYLEIGCGPAHIGDYLLKNNDVYFIGVDFNYKMLLTLKKYFDEKGFKKYLLVYSDINSMPLKDGSIDFIYGGGVIEHMPDTKNILKELYRVLRAGGISYNTVPAFNLWWLTRFYNTIPYAFCRKLFDFIHLNLLKGRLLESGAGYQLGYTMADLQKLHEFAHFKNIHVSSFAFHPSNKMIKNRILSELYFNIQKINQFCAVYQVYGEK